MSKYLYIHAHLEGTDVWRRICVRADISFEDLHLLLQQAFGWKNYHLYEFRKGRQEVAVCPGSESYSPEPAPDADEVTVGTILKKKGSRCEYVYDFGDGWEVALAVEASKSESRSSDEPWLLAGELAGPPEDCGGVLGYERIVQFCKTGIDPYGDDAEELRGWLDGWSPDAFRVTNDNRNDPLEIDIEKLDEGALAILSLTLHDEGRVWKGLDWNIMNRLHERGWILDPKSKAKSVVMTNEGIVLAKDFLRKHFQR